MEHRTHRWQPLRAALAALSVLAFPDLALGAENHAQATIERLQYNGLTNEVAVWVVGDHLNPNGCELADRYIVPQDRNPNAMLSVLLAAHLAGRRVSLMIGEGGCSTQGRPLLIAVTLH